MSGQSLYQEIGGEEGLRRLVETFYDIVDREELGEHLHLLHMRGHGVAHSREEQFAFLSGFLGGPRLYVERHGHSNVRQMHAHVEIGPEARDAWLNCMRLAMERIGLGDHLRSRLDQHFTRVATQLRNRE